MSLNNNKTLVDFFSRSKTLFYVLVWTDLLVLSLMIFVITTPICDEGIIVSEIFVEENHLYW